jgi:hypothetical protein
MALLDDGWTEEQAQGLLDGLELSGTERDEMSNAARKPVKLSDHESITFVGAIERGFQFGPLRYR